MTFSTDVDLKQLAVRRDGPGTVPIAPKRRVFSRYVLPGVLVIGFIGIFGWAARDAYLPRQRVTIVPVLMSLADVQTAGTPLFKAAGWVEPRPTPIRVAALAGGVVEELLVVEDQLVAKDEPIARLVARDSVLSLHQAQAIAQMRQAELDQAHAALAAARTNFDQPAHLELPLAEAEFALAVVETELSNLPFSLERANARFRVAELDLEGKNRARSAVPGITIDRAQSELDAAQAEVNELSQRGPVLERQRVALIRRRDASALRLKLKTDERQSLATTQAAVAAAESLLEQAHLAVQEAQLRLDRMTIVAPVSGRILKLLAAPGMQLMTSGLSLAEGSDSSTVVTMYDPKQLQIRVDVRFEDLPRVGRGQPATIESPALSRPLDGSVLFLTGFANIQKNTLEVKVSLTDAPHVLKPEMLVDVTFLSPETDAPQNASAEEYRLFIPRVLLETGEGGSFVWVADVAAGVAHRRAVALGAIQTPALAEITQGLTAASRLIAAGRESLHDGDRIKITGEDQALDAATAPASPAGARQTDMPGPHH